MVQNQILLPVSEPTDWVSSMVILEKKDGSLRVCIDPKDLNNAMKRSHYPTPTIDDITSELKDAKLFSTFDTKNGYW